MPFEMLTLLVEWIIKLASNLMSLFCGLCFKASIKFDSGRKVRLGDSIGEGAFSFVYKAHSCESGEQFALKKMYMQSSDLQKVTKNEIDSLQKFQHHNIIKMIDFSFAHEPGKGQVAYLLFPFTSKGSLRDILNTQLKSSSRPQLFNVLSGFRDICKAVNVLHSFSPAYVHRDIKPENILFSESWSPLLIDFGSVGLAETFISNRGESLRVADESAQLCTVSYRPPELFEPPVGVQLDTRTDVWSLGCLLFAWYYGYSPFESEFNEHGTLRVVECSHLRVLAKAPKRPNSSAEDLVIQGLTDWILDKNISNRPFTDDIVSKVDETIKIRSEIRKLEVER